MSELFLCLFRLSKNLCCANSMFVKHSVSSYRRSPVTGFALVCWGAQQQLAEEFFMVGLGLALIVGVALVHL